MTKPQTVTAKEMAERVASLRAKLDQEFGRFDGHLKMYHHWTDQTDTAVIADLLNGTHQAAKAATWVRETVAQIIADAADLIAAAAALEWQAKDAEREAMRHPEAANVRL